MLAQFPGPVTLNASRRKWSVIFLFSAMFAVGGLWELLDGDPKGWFVFAVFGLSSMVAATAMRAGSQRIDIESRLLRNDKPVSRQSRALARRQRLHGHFTPVSNGRVRATTA